MPEREVRAASPLDKQPKEYFKSISLAFHMNELLLHYGEDHDKGRRDVTWHDLSERRHCLLMRYRANDEILFQLTVTATVSDDDGYQDEFTITFAAEKGVINKSGDLPDELISTGKDEVGKTMVGLVFIESILTTYS